MRRLAPPKAGYVLVQCGKIALILRLLCAYPVVLSWPHDPGLLELLLLGATMLASLGLLLGWHRLAPLITRHPAIMGVDIIVALLIFASTAAHGAYLAYLGSTALLIGLFFDAVGRVLLTALLSAGYAAVQVYRAVVETLPGPAGFPAVLGALMLFAALAYVGGSMRALQDRVNASMEAVRNAAGDAALGEERSRIARELHDSLVKTLVGIDLQAKALAMAGGPAEGARSISESAQQAIRESRTLLTDLRTASNPPLERALENIAAELQAFHPVRIRLETNGCCRLPTDVRYTAVKVAEEALVNAAKHSGAEEIRCTARCEDGWLHLEIADDGAGFRLRRRRVPGHYGLTGMRERAEEIGGTLTLDSEEGSGTRVLLSVPIASEEETHDAPARADRR